MSSIFFGFLGGVAGGFLIRACKSLIRAYKGWVEEERKRRERENAGPPGWGMEGRSWP